MMTGLSLVAPLAGWLMPLSAVPDPVFADRMMGDGVAIDPTGDTLHAPCDATVVTIHAAGHAITLATAAGADLLIHIGIDSVALAGEGFTRLVEPGASVRAGDPLIRFDLDLLARRASALATPIVLTTSDGFALADIAPDGLVAVGDPMLRIVAQAATAATATSTGALATRSVTVALPHGLHARPAARIAAAVKALDATAALVRDGQRAGATAIVGMLALDLANGTMVSIEAEGRDADAAIAAIAAILTATVDPDAAAPIAAPVTTQPDDGKIRGVTAVPGLAVGAVQWLRVAVPEAPATGAGAAAERASLTAGLDRLRAELDAGATAGGHVGGVLAAHRAILDDPDLIAACEAAIDHGSAAAAAALAVTQGQADSLARARDRRIAERAADLIDVGRRLAYAILGTRPPTLAVADGGILLADDLLPSDFAALDGVTPAGIATVRGGPTSHVAIMAAGRGIPMVVAIGDKIETVPDGAVVILDADLGTIDLAPDAAAVAEARRRIGARATAEAAALALLRDGETRTRDGTAVSVQVNLGTADEAVASVAAGAEGCGLLRTELLFLDRATPPTIDEQAADYRGIATAMAGRPLTIRLLDIGGDKPAPYLAIAPEDNPALGLRGVRVLLARPDVLDAQLRAILAAADAGPCRIMVPMVASVAELDAVRAVLDRLRAETGAAPVALGAMIETPAAAIAADLIAARADFLSIGSNDLTQYALAMDRGNAAVAAGLDGLHPAVLRLIAATCDGARRHGVPVGVCGGLAADPLAAPILVGLGITSLSVPPARVAPTRALVAGLSIEAARVHAAAALATESPQAIRALARRFAEEHAA